MGILEAILTLIALVVAILVGVLPFEIISQFSDVWKRPKSKSK